MYHKPWRACQSATNLHSKSSQKPNISAVIDNRVQFDCSFIDPKGIRRVICYGLPSTTCRFPSASSLTSHSIRQSDTIVCRSHPFIPCHLARHLQPILLSFAFDSWAVVCCCIRDLDSCPHIPVPQGSCHRRLVQEIRQCGQNCPEYRRILRSADFPGSLQRAEVGQGSSLRFSSYVMHVAMCVELEFDFFSFSFRNGHLHSYVRQPSFYPFH